MMAQAPWSSTATATAAAPPAIEPAIVISSSRRKFISRSSSDCWVAPMAVSTKLNDSADMSGPTSGSP